MLNLKKNIEIFLSHCRYEKNLSKKTIKAYTIDLQQFTVFLENKKIEMLDKIDKNILKEYLQQLFSFNHKARTIKRKCAALKTFFNHLEFEDIITINPFRKVKNQYTRRKTTAENLNLY